MKFTPRSEDDAKKLAIKEPLKPGSYEGVITEAIEKHTRESQKDMMEVTIKIGGRDIKDWIVGENDIDALKLRHLAEAIGMLDRYDAGELSQDDLPGHQVKVVLSVKRGKGFLPRNAVEDYKPSSSSVVPLRTTG